MNTEILLYDGCDELDFVGPFEVLTTAGFDVTLVTAQPATAITTARGVGVMPGGQLSELPELLVVPGGGWNDRGGRGAWAEAARGDLPRAIAERHDAGSTVASVCTGAMLVAAAGLLTGRPAVTHKSAIADLRAGGAIVIEDARVVDDGDVLSAGGVTSGIDLGLWLVERELGADAAAAVQRELEYTRAGTVWRSRSVA